MKRLDRLIYTAGSDRQSLHKWMMLQWWCQFQLKSTERGEWNGTDILVNEIMWHRVVITTMNKLRRAKTRIDIQQHTTEENRTEIGDTDWIKTWIGHRWCVPFTRIWETPLNRMTFIISWHWRIQWNQVAFVVNRPRYHFNWCELINEKNKDLYMEALNLSIAAAVPPVLPLKLELCSSSTLFSAAAAASSPSFFSFLFSFHFQWSFHLIHI